MSNRENPCAGYLIEASKLAVFVSPVSHPAFHDALAEHDFEAIIKVLDQAIPDGVARPSQIFVLSDTDTGDGELEEDVAYAFFDEDDLFIKQERPELIRLRAAIGEAPAAHSWTIWG